MAIPEPDATNLGEPIENLAMGHDEDCALRIPYPQMMLFIVLTFTMVGCPIPEEGNASGKKSPTADSGVSQGLLTAYAILEDTLSQEAKLGALGFLKKITFSRPVPEIDALMKRISKVSEKRIDELEDLRKLAPDASAAPDYMDPIGNAITSNATRSGMDEMLDRHGSFGIRFVFLQAQATRMVSAIALAAAEVEPNERRRKWLKDLSIEYESIRDALVVIVEKYIRQEGEAQIED